MTEQQPGWNPHPDDPHGNDPLPALPPPAQLPPGQSQSNQPPAGQAGVLRPPGRWATPPAPKIGRQHGRLWIALIAALVLVVGAGAGAGVVWALTPRQAPAAAPPEPQNQDLRTVLAADFISFLPRASEFPEGLPVRVLTPSGGPGPNDRLVLATDLDCPVAALPSAATSQPEGSVIRALASIEGHFPAETTFKGDLLVEYFREEGRFDFIQKAKAIPANCGGGNVWMPVDHPSADPDPWASFEAPARDGSARVAWFAVARVRGAVVVVSVAYDQALDADGHNLKSDPAHDEHVRMLQDSVDRLMTSAVRNLRAA